VTEPRITNRPDPAAEAVAAAIARLAGDGGGATPADIATAAGVAYSTTNKKLRALREAGRAEPFDSPDKRTLWRLTTAGQTGTATEPEPVESTSGTEPGPAAEPAPDDGDPGAASPPATVAEPTVAETGDGEAGVAETGDGEAGVAETGDGEAGDEEPADDGTAADGAAPVATAAAAPVAESAEPPDGTGPDDAPADPLDIADGAADVAGDAADAGEAVQPATRRVPRPRRTTAEPADGDDGDATAVKLRRPPGSLRGAILDILEADPTGTYKVGALCKLIDKASEGTGYAKASQGAVYNEAIKLVGAHRAVQTADKHATFQIAPPTAG